MSSPAPPLQILLVEPQFVLRRTVVAVARALGVGTLYEAASNAAALPRLAAQPFDGIVLDTGELETVSRLLARLRAGAFASTANVPVLALVTAVDRASVAVQLEPFAINSTLDKPFKVAELLQWIAKIGR